MSEEHGPVLNTDRELWRETPGDYYSPRLFVTEDGGIGVSVGGYTIILPIRKWHALGSAYHDDLVSSAPEICGCSGFMHDPDCPEKPSK